MVLPGLQVGFFERVKLTVLSGFLALPYLLVIVTGFLGGITGNLGLSILFLGQVFLVPAVQIIFGFLRQTPLFTDTFRLGSVPKLDPSCSLVPDITKAGNFAAPVTSDWLAQVSFFFGFIIFNAFTVYNLEPAKGANPANVENRKSQAVMSMLLSVVVGIGLITVFLNTTKCETTGSFIFGTLAFFSLGIFGFYMASQCGIKQSDIFGIAGKIHSITPDSNEYQNVCVPLKNNTCKK